MEEFERSLKRDGGRERKGANERDTERLDLGKEMKKKGRTKRMRMKGGTAVLEDGPVETKEGAS